MPNYKHFTERKPPLSEKTQERIRSGIKRHFGPPRPEHHAKTSLMGILDKAIPGAAKDVADQDRREKAQLNSKAHKLERARALKLQKDIARARRDRAQRYWLYQTPLGIAARPTHPNKNTDPNAQLIGDPEGYASAHEALVESGKTHAA